MKQTVKVRTLSAWGIGCVVVCAIVIAFALGFVFYLTAHADPTDTPMPTPTSFINTPLMFPTDYSCGEGNPLGWLTLTPDPFWLLMCEQCVDRPGTPTPNLTPTATVPTVTGTPPTQTPTPTATSAPYTLSCNSCSGASTCTQVNSYTVRFDVQTSVRTANNSGFGCSANIAYPYTIQSYLYWFGEFEVTGQSVSAGFDGGSVYTHQYTQLLGSAYDDVYSSGSMSPGLSSYYGSGEVSGSAWIENTNSRHDLYDSYFFQVPQSDRIEVYETGYIIYSMQPISFVTPTVTPTPDGSFCSVVMEEEEEEDDEPFIEWGDQSCVKLISEVDISWTGLEGTIPETWACYQEVSFRVVEILGVSINLMVALYVLLGSAIIVWIFKT